MAVSCVLLPAIASTCVGRTTTLATGVFCTVIAAIPDLPFELAATWVAPAARAVTTPIDDTLAMAVSLTDQTMDTPGIVLPVASCTCACRGSCAPTMIVDAGGVTMTAATVSPPAPGWTSVELLHDSVSAAAAPTITQRTQRVR